jgi:hypothetical protein
MKVSRICPMLFGCVALSACSPQAGQQAGDAVSGSLSGATMNIWTDPETGCRYFLYKEGWAQVAIGGMSIRFRKDGKPDCPGSQTPTPAPSG